MSQDHDVFFYKQHLHFAGSVPFDSTSKTARQENPRKSPSDPPTEATMALVSNSRYSDLVSTVPDMYRYKTAFPFW